VPTILVDGPTDPRLVEYRDLREPQRIHARGHFVAEGRFVVQRLIDDGRYVIRSILLSPAALSALRMDVARLDPAVCVYVAPLEQFFDITGFNIHRGCLALVDRPAPLLPEKLIAAASLIVVLEEVANADNVGGIFRNAAAFGADAVLLSPGCCDPLYRKAIRTSMAAALRVPFARLDDWPADLAVLDRGGLEIAALTPDASAVPLDDFAPAAPGRLALLVGAEGAGLSAGALAAARHRVRIPINRDVDSLNVSVAAGIALSRLSRLTNLAHLA
jgi:tRNA G18 (ribose-2'-O)-methylase SpoU